MDKMIKVLIVEDEMLLLQGLKKLVDWQALGFTLCETAANYMDAVSAAYLHKPDLLLTDIMLGEGQRMVWSWCTNLERFCPKCRQYC